eukprot:747952-Hanusia_phi.AAC.4
MIHWHAHTNLVNIRRFTRNCCTVCKPLGRTDSGRRPGSLAGRLSTSIATKTNGSRTRRKGPGERLCSSPDELWQSHGNAFGTRKCSNKSERPGMRRLRMHNTVYEAHYLTRSQWGRAPS